MCECVHNKIRNMFENLCKFDVCCSPQQGSPLSKSLLSAKLSPQQLVLLVETLLKKSTQTRKIVRMNQCLIVTTSHLRKEDKCRTIKHFAVYLVMEVVLID